MTNLIPLTLYVICDFMKMNLYDKDDGFHVFTLVKANALLPDVIKITQLAVDSLEEAKSRLKSEELDNKVQAHRRFEEGSSEILEEWAQQIMSLGVYPKGYFTVDFKSPTPDTLFCWSYGEEVITHTHKIFESFKDRVPLRDSIQPGFEDSLN